MSTIIRPGTQLSENEWEAIKTTFLKKYEENVHLTGWASRNAFTGLLDSMKKNRNDPMAFGLIVRWAKPVRDEIGKNKSTACYSVSNISKEIRDVAMEVIEKDILPYADGTDISSCDGINTLLHTVIRYAHTLCPNLENARDNLVLVCAQLYLEACERKDVSRAHYFSRMLLVNQYTEDGYGICSSTMYVSEKTPTTTIN